MNGNSDIEIDDDLISRQMVTRKLESMIPSYKDEIPSSRIKIMWVITCWGHVIDRSYEHDITEILIIKNKKIIWNYMLIV